MDSLRTALTSVKDLLDWLPDPAVALLILAFAVLFALALHRWARKLVRRAIRWAVSIRVFRSLHRHEVSPAPRC